MAAAVELPVTADLERGYGDARLTLECAIEAGAVGCNLEDSDGKGGLWPAEEHAAVVAAARAAGDAAGVPIVINARTDVFLPRWFRPRSASSPRWSAARRTSKRARTASSCPASATWRRSRRWPRRWAARSACIGGAGGPRLAELARLGVARVSYGPGPMGVAMAALSRAAETLLAGGEPPADLAFRV